jgi:putative tryptophan/tyrosine transport system substrate-binding protein
MVGMRRRDFAALLSGGAVAWPFAAQAQQSERVRRVGVLVPYAETHAEAKKRISAFGHELQKLGWSEGRNVIVESRFGGGGSERVRTHAAELLRMAPDVILAETTQAMLELQQTTRTVPIVFVNVADPVEAGFVSNLARPEGNITGFANIDIATTGKWLELLREITPGLSQVLVIFDPKNPITPRRMRAIETAAQSLSIQLTRAAIHDVGDIEHAIKTFARESNGSLVALASPFMDDHRAVISASAMQHRLPAVYAWRFYVTSGGLMSYGTDVIDQYRGAASYVDRILRGAKPSDLPVQLPTKFELVINLKTAKALGLTVPQSLLATAEEVIE